MSWRHRTHTRAGTKRPVGILWVYFSFWLKWPPLLLFPLSLRVEGVLWQCLDHPHNLVAPRALPQWLQFQVQLAPPPPCGIEHAWRSKCWRSVWKPWGLFCDVSPPPDGMHMAMADFLTLFFSWSLCSLHYFYWLLHYNVLVREWRCVRKSKTKQKTPSLSTLSFVKSSCQHVSAALQFSLSHLFVLMLVRSWVIIHNVSLKHPFASRIENCSKIFVWWLLSFIVFLWSRLCVRMYDPIPLLLILTM